MDDGGDDNDASRSFGPKSGFAGFENKKPPPARAKAKRKPRVQRALSTNSEQESQTTTDFGTQNSILGGTARGSNKRGTPSKAAKAVKEVPKVDLVLGASVPSLFLTEIRNALFQWRPTGAACEFNVTDLSKQGTGGVPPGSGFFGGTEPPVLDSPFAVIRSSWDYASHMEKVSGAMEQENTRRPACQVPCVIGFLDRTGENRKKPIIDDETCAATMTALKEFQAQQGAARAVLVVRNRDSTSTGYLARGLVAYDLDMVEIFSLEEAGAYVCLVLDAIVKSRTKKTTGEFHNRSEGCKSVPHSEGRGAMFVNWVSMLMEVPGCGEEMAKVVANRWPSLATLLDALESAVDIVKSEMRELMVPQRGKSETRKLGPVLANRICNFFVSENPAEIAV
ncbi:unnamed protein product [Amoebophrya sp. A25]|nr:unnamed protein product [Amoebophrya sp. A25]|eukprot:GSA25T00021908001.1